MYLWPPKTSLDKTDENNRQEWEKLPLQLLKHFQNRRFLQKNVKPKDAPLDI